MATKKGNEHDPATVQVVDILPQIRTELGGLHLDINARLDAAVLRSTGTYDRWAS